jgi:hypothetical protein
MPTPPQKPTGRTPWDVVSEVISRRSVIVWLAIIPWVAIATAIYSWTSGAIRIGANQHSSAAPSPSLSTANSPFLHWWQLTTTKSLSECKLLTRDVYDLVGHDILETHDFDSESNSVGQTAVWGSVTSSIVCTPIGNRVSILIAAAGPDQSITKNRAANLRDVVRTKLVP